MSDSTEVVNNDSIIPQNVLPIKNKANRSKASGTDKPAEKKPKKANLYEAIFNAITQNPLALLPRPKFNIAVTEIVRGFKIPIEILGEGDFLSCRRIENLDTIASLIMKYTRTTLAGHEAYCFTAQDCSDCAKYWFMASDSIETPPLIKYMTDPGLCWNRLPFLLKQGATPSFDELFARMSNARAVKTWIGSLFVSASYDQQYVWLRGEGNDGKSSLMEFLARVFGDEGSLALGEAPGSDKHWAEGWIGKRFVYFPDFEDIASLKKGPLKMITGGDRITIRPFYRPGTHSVKFPAKLMFSSNPPPRFDFNKSDKRRLIYAEMTASSLFVSSTYSESLWAEGGAFLQSCIDLYGEVCSDHGMIPTDEGSLAVLEDRRDRADIEDFQLWFDFYFIRDDMSTSECSANEVADAIQQRFPEYRSRMGAYGWLERKGLRLKQYRKEGKDYRTYKGIRRKKLDIRQQIDPNYIPS